MVDWLLDRFRTAVNCFGDSVGAAIVDGVMEEGDALLDENPEPEGATA
jgi:Na+/H+-dicarboxylate symporter